MAHSKLQTLAQWHILKSNLVGLANKLFVNYITANFHWEIIWNFRWTIIWSKQFYGPIGKIASTDVTVKTSPRFTALVLKTFRIFQLKFKKKSTDAQQLHPLCNLIYFGGNFKSAAFCICIGPFCHWLTLTYRIVWMFFSMDKHCSLYSKVTILANYTIGSVLESSSTCKKWKYNNEWTKSAVSRNRI